MNPETVPLLLRRIGEQSGPSISANQIAKMQEDRSEHHPPGCLGQLHRNKSDLRPDPW